MKILIATSNNGKLKEFKALLQIYKTFSSKYEFISLNELNINVPAPIENGKTYYENALIKAKYYYEMYGIPTISDDSGIEVESLNNMPGIYSSRYGSLNGYLSNVDCLENALKGVTNRNAKMVANVVFYDENVTFQTEGVCCGKIIDDMRGNNGFGYDPVFFLDEYQKTFAEISDELKNKISHRAIAFKKLIYMIDQYYETCQKEELIKTKLNAIYKNSNVEILERLKNGMSNYTYLVKVDNNTMVARLPGENAELFVKRKNEMRALNEVETLFKQSYYEHFMDDGFMVSKYFSGKPLNEISLNDEILSSVADILHKIHQMPTDLGYDNPFTRLTNFEKMLEKVNNTHIYPKNYNTIKEFLLDQKSIISNTDKCFIHGDAQKSNFMVGENNNVMLFDYEFACTGDEYYDIACFGNNDINDAYKLLTIYLKNIENENIKDKAKLRVSLWSIFQALQWYNVAMIKEYTGFSMRLNFDFKSLADWYLNKALNIISSIKNF